MKKSIALLILLFHNFCFAAGTPSTIKISPSEQKHVETKQSSSLEMQPKNPEPQELMEIEDTPPPITTSPAEIPPEDLPPILALPNELLIRILTLITQDMDILSCLHVNRRFQSLTMDVLTRSNRLLSQIQRSPTFYCPSDRNSPRTRLRLMMASVSEERVSVELNCGSLSDITACSLFSEYIELRITKPCFHDNPGELTQYKTGTMPPVCALECHYNRSTPTVYAIIRRNQESLRKLTLIFWRQSGSFPQISLPFIYSIFSLNLNALTSLDLSQAYLGDWAVWIITQNRGNLPKLNHLDLGNSEVTSRGARWIADSPLLGQLKTLGLGSNKLYSAGVIHILMSPYAANLRDLNLSNNGITPSMILNPHGSWRTAFFHNYLGTLRNSWNETPEDASTRVYHALMTTTQLPKLRRLQIQGNHVYSGRQQQILDSPNFPKLREVFV